MFTRKNGVFWCKDEADWKRFREIVADPETLNISYDEWLKLSQSRFDELVKAGIPTGSLFIKVKADPDAFIKWCQINSHPLNQKSRMLYAVEKSHQIVGSG